MLLAAVVLESVSTAVRHPCSSVYLVLVNRAERGDSEAVGSMVPASRISVSVRLIQ